MNRMVQPVLIATVVFFVLALGLGQVMVPIVASDTGRSLPEVAHLVGPYSVLGIATLACFQIAAILIGIILSARSAHDVYSRPTRGWITAIGVLCIVGCLIPVAVGIRLLATVHAGGPGVFLGIAAGIVGAIGFGCLTHLALRAYDVTRSEHDELSEVI